MLGNDRSRDGATPFARPPALRPGDRVAVLTLSSPAQHVLLADGLDALRFAGLEPVVYPSVRASGTVHPYLAGDDRSRAAELRQALLDESIAGVVFACGGYGAQRTLEAMDWSGLEHVAPKVLSGYSDVTAILEAIAVKLGWASLMSAMVCCGEFAQSYTFSSMLRALMSPERVRELHYGEAVTVVGGTARGTTLGGNLALLASSVGTDTSLPARGGILLLEDEQENDYRVDRMLTQLRRSGYLDGVAAVIAGSWYQCGTVEQIHPVLTDRLGDLGVPVIAWANVGHGGRFQSFPIGVRAELDADRRTLRLLDPPLVPSVEREQPGMSSTASRD
ncbi:muramoyltetrapeptide carboxypeptidase [Rugosimonospora africana]|uniref:Muramoyltetrapeptide carboxypeptidase n=1 Tax=Rugosimonospora africana TaxID=556532 RepID=A0A8J3VQQ8_9ACTN|nr:muramoyltetrapeptide carboxypeptidase [Rugosimonospora africana]